MKQIDRLFCLFSGAPPPAVLQHTVHLAGAVGASICVIKRGEAVKDVLDRLHREQQHVTTARPVGIEEQPVSDGAPGVARLIRRRVEERKGRGLLLVGGGVLPETASPPADSFVWEVACRVGQPVWVLVGNARPESVQRLLVPTDFSEVSVEALKYAALLASAYETRLSLLHVIEDNPYVALTSADRLSLKGPTLPEQRARRRLRKIVDVSWLADVQTQMQVRFGEPVSEIADVVREKNVDVVVVPARACGATSSGVAFPEAIAVPANRIAQHTGTGISFGLVFVSEGREREQGAPTPEARQGEKG